MPRFIQQHSDKYLANWILDLSSSKLVEMQNQQNDLIIQYKRNLQR